MKLLNNYNVGIYCRLSREDFKNGKGDTSMSIENQKRILGNAVAERGWVLTDTYMDNGYTGVNFNRRNFQQMLRDLKSGRINCVMVKNLDRFGRGARTGVYIEEHFIEPQKRFIALGENVDTVLNCDELINFYHAMSGIYPKMVSKKVRATKRENGAAGMFMNSQAPFGYAKSPENKHKLIIDDVAAQFVRQIFNEYVGGDSARMIADRLTRASVDNPIFYCYARQGKKNLQATHKNVWNSGSVLNILRNEVYIGTIVSGKREVASIVTKKVRRIDPADWVRVENMHEPIIPRELWDRVQMRLRTRARVYECKHTKAVGLFSGLLRCQDCGSPLAYSTKHLKSGDKGIYRCSAYNNKGKSSCTSHYIDEAIVSAAVLHDVRAHAVLSVMAREHLTKQLMTSLKKVQTAEAGVMQAQIEKLEKRLAIIDSTLKSLYENKATGEITKEQYNRRSREYEQEQVSIERELPKLRREHDDARETKGNIDDWLNMIQDCLNISELDRPTVMGLVDKIIVSERTKVDGKTNQEIAINYRFIGSLLQN